MAEKRQETALALPRVYTQTAAYSFSSGRALALVLAVYLVWYFLFWALEALMFHEVPHPDDVEQLLWAAHPALGYSKHPPLPSLVLFAVEHVVRPSIGLVYWMGAGCVAAAMVFAWQAGAATLGPALARIGILAMTCISFYTQRMHLYNNNTALLVANAAAMLCVWRAVMSNRNGWWFALGIAWGAGMLSKYQMALPILCNIAFVAASDRDWLRSRVAGLSIAAATSIALLIPHVFWLFQNHFPTFKYAATELLAYLPVTSRPNNISSFFADEAWRTFPAILLLRAMYAVRGPREPPAGPAANVVHVRRFWLIHAWGPMVIMFSLAAIGGVDLQMHWGTAFLWAMPFWFLSTNLGSRLGTLSFSHALACAAGVQTLLVLFKLAWPQY